MKRRKIKGGQSVLITNGRKKITALTCRAKLMLRRHSIMIKAAAVA